MLFLSAESNKSTPDPDTFEKRIATHIPFISRCFCKSMPSPWQKVVYPPPICVTIRLPFVSRYFCRSIRVRGRWNTPNLSQRRHDRLYLHGPHPRKTMAWNHGLHPLKTMVLKIPALAPGYRKEHRSGRNGGFQDHGSEVVPTIVPDHGFARVGTMQVQAIMPPLIKEWTMVDG